MDSAGNALNVTAVIQGGPVSAAAPACPICRQLQVHPGLLLNVQAIGHSALRSPPLQMALPPHSPSSSSTQPQMPLGGLPV